MDQRNFTYLFYGLLSVWLVLMAYVVSLGAREKRLGREIEALKRMIEDREKG